MTSRADPTHGASVDLESPFLAEVPWARPTSEEVRDESLEGESPFLASEWDGEIEDERGELQEELLEHVAYETQEPIEEHLADEEEGEALVCRECGHAHEVDELFLDEAELLDREDRARAIQDRQALDAELGIGGTPFLVGFLSEAANLPPGIAAFAQTLGAEWATKVGDKTADAKTAELLQDYRDTLVGARNRYGSKYSVEVLGRAWMISRQQEMLFRMPAPGVKPLGTFAPPAERPQLIVSKVIDGSDEAPVAPLAETFVWELRRRYTGRMSASTYPKHGGGKFDGRGFSIDLWLSGLDDRGFYPKDEAIKFLHAVHEAATAVRAQWRVIYNDSRVADAVNRALGRRHVIFVGTVRKSGGKVKGLNWHGPSPFILHLHLDLAPLTGSSSTWDGSTSSTTSTPATTVPSAAPGADLVRFAQRVLNAAEGERLAADGDMGKLTRGALERFSKRYGLRSGTLDATMELGLAQRVLEELAQVSMFAQFGVRDAATERALIDWKTQRGLMATPTIDAPTRAALADAIERRTAPRPQPAPTRRPTSPAPAVTDVDRDTVARIDQYRDGIERHASQFGVSPNLVRGVIAAESSGKPNSGAGGTGYKGLMQAGTELDQLQPENSLRKGADKLKKFASWMRSFFRDKLSQDFDALPDDVRVRITAAAYNAGQGSVQRAMRYARAAGDVSQWLAPEHYVRSLLSWGAYSSSPSVIEWCVKKGHLTAEDLVADLARLSGRSADDVRRQHGANVKALATALKPHLLRENKTIRNDGSATLVDMRSRASKSLVCAASFKHAHTNGYLDTIVRYKRYYESRP